jgi:hypothetical protein
MPDSLPETVYSVDRSLSPTPPPPGLTQAGRPQRRYRLPKRYEDILPEGPTPVPLADSADSGPAASSIRRVILHVRDAMRTGLNRFRILREYPHRPSYDPDSSIPVDELSNSTSTRIAPVESPNTSHAAPWPFKNMSIYLLMEWMTTGSSQKSIGEVDRLVRDVISHSKFRAADLAGFNARHENKRLDVSEDVDSDITPFSRDGWVPSTVHIKVPTGIRDPEGGGQDFAVVDLYHRPLLGVMKAAITDIAARRFHFSPFKRLWLPPSGIEQRCFDEVYTSDSFLEANDKLQKQPNEPGCSLEKVVLGLMFWSDSTHLANFGNAKVWPIYLYCANLSKYIRGKPGSAACHHVAYIPSVSLIIESDTTYLIPIPHLFRYPTASMM